MSGKQPLNVFAIGASRNIGYHSAKRLLASGATVTFLLRSTAVFDSDEEIQQYVKSGHARLVKGDALVREDVKRAWETASKDRKVDFVLSTVGGTPKFTFGKGFVMDPPNLVTQSLINVLSTMPESSRTPGDQTGIIAISSIGLTRTSHKSVPLALKPLYNWALTAPHEDKVGAERVLAHCAGWSWDSAENGEPSAEILWEGWKETEGLPSPGSLKKVLVIRPALLTDADAVADKPAKAGKQQKEPYRVSESEINGYTVSRKDVAHFVVDAMTNKWEQYEGKKVNIVY